VDEIEPREWAQFALHCDDTAQAWVHLESAMHRLGLQQCVLVVDQPVTRRDVPPRTRKFGCTIHEDWERRLYDEPNLATSDPVPKRFLAQDGMLRVWRGSEFFESLSDDQKRFFRNYYEHGFTAGATWSAHDRVRGTASVLLTSTSESARDYQETVNRVGSAVSFGLHYFGEALRVKQLAGRSRRPLLTPREKECLLWVQAGKPTRDISDVLNISEATVNEHITNAMRKLGASSRVQASVRAALLRLITP
jgi:DNA-binding CsgD family transcriptional regulator